MRLSLAPMMSQPVAMKVEVLILMPAMGQTVMIAAAAAEVAVRDHLVMKAVVMASSGLRIVV